MRQPAAPSMLLLAGTSEAGKSSAGEYLAALGARRVKIRTVLVQLTSGRQAYHEGMETREDFGYDEFVSKLLELSDRGESPLAVESFIDAALARTVKRTWPAPCSIIFITAPEPVRVRRLAQARGLTADEARRIIRRKDERKRVHEQIPTWRAIADHWVDNTANIIIFRARLRDAFQTMQTSSGGIQP
ncbi:cytidylate kinase family protein [Micromonospora harpali]|uniref:Cytidylate kinase family protein n=1 Tax=Micromonospora harpali TaxID=1490225 RepID=A0ABW1HI38_9ACTN